MWRMKVLFRSSWWQTAGQTWVIKVWKGRASVSHRISSAGKTRLTDSFSKEVEDEMMLMFKKERLLLSSQCLHVEQALWVDLWPLLIVQLIMFQWPIMLWPPRQAYKFCKQLLIVAIFQGFPSTPADAIYYLVPVNRKTWTDYWHWNELKIDVYTVQPSFWPRARGASPKLL